MSDYLNKVIDEYYSTVEEFSTTEVVDSDLFNYVLVQIPKDGKSIYKIFKKGTKLPKGAVIIKSSNNKNDLKDNYEKFSIEEDDDEFAMWNGLGIKPKQGFKYAAFNGKKILKNLKDENDVREYVLTHRWADNTYGIMNAEGETMTSDDVLNCFNDDEEFASPYRTPNFDQKLKPYQKFFKDLEEGDIFYESDWFEGPTSMNKVIKKHKPGLYDIETIRCKYWEDVNSPILKKYGPKYDIFEDTVVEIEPYIQFRDSRSRDHIGFKKGKSEWFGLTFEEYWADRKDKSAYVKFSNDEDFAISPYTHFRLPSDLNTELVKNAKIGDKIYTIYPDGLKCEEVITKFKNGIKEVELLRSTNWPSQIDGIREDITRDPNVNPYNFTVFPLELNVYYGDDVKVSINKPIGSPTDYGMTFNEYKDYVLGSNKS